MCERVEKWWRREGVRRWWRRGGIRWIGGGVRRWRSGGEGGVRRDVPEGTVYI